MLFPVKIVCRIFLIVFVLMMSAISGRGEAAKTTLPDGVVPFTYQPTKKHLAIETPEARALYEQIQRGDYPSIDELLKNPVVLSLDALSRYYVELYGNTKNINTPERQKLREQILHDYLNYGSARRIINGQGKKEWIFDGSLKKEYKAILVFGLPATGKTSFYTNPQSEKMQAFILDTDMIMYMFPEYKETFGGASDALVFESANLRKIAMNNFIKGDMRGVNVLIPVVVEDFNSVMNIFIHPFEEAGYDVRAVYIEGDLNLSLARNVSRELRTGRLYSTIGLLSLSGNPERVYYRLKDMKNSKGNLYGMGIFRKYPQKNF